MRVRFPAQLGGKFWTVEAVRVLLEVHRAAFWPGGARCGVPAGVGLLLGVASDPGLRDDFTHEGS